MAKDGKEERLRQLPLFREADGKAIDFLASAADEATVSAGYELIRQGGRNSEVYVLESGSAVVEIDGNEVAKIPAGELVGELSYFTRKNSSATVKVAEEAQVLVIPHNTFEQVMEDNPALVRAIVAELAERLEATDLKLKSMGS